MSKNATPTLAGKIAVRAMAVDALDDAAPLIEDALTDELPAEVAEGVISASFDPADFIEAP